MLLTPVAIVVIATGIAFMSFKSGAPVPTGMEPRQEASDDLASGLGFGGSTNVGKAWSPDTDPLGQGTVVSLANSRDSAGFSFFTPISSATSDDAIANVWLGTETEGGGLLPGHDQSTVAISYKSGVVVTYVPWVYGPNAPAFSYVQQADAIKQAVSSSGGLISGSTIDSVPAKAIAQNYGGEGGPGSVEVQLGTANSDALTVTVLGRLDVANLTDLMASIVSQWEQAHPGAAAQ